MSLILLKQKASALWARTPAVVKWVALGVLVAVLSFGIGRWTAPQPVATTSTTTSSTTTTGSTTSNTNTTGTTQVQVVYQNQATIKQDHDTDCTEDFDPNTGRLVKRRCITKTVTASTDNTSSTTNGSSTSNSNTSTSSTNTSTTNTTTTVVTKPVVEPKSTGWHVSGIASMTLFDGSAPALKPSYGIGLSHTLVGPLSLGGAVYTDKTATLSLNLELGKDWSVSASAGMRFQDIVDRKLDAAFYGGSVDRRLLGPVYVGVWAYSDRTAGASLSVSF